MGEVRVKMQLRNEADVFLYEQGKLSESEIRSAQVDALVDTGAVMMLLPQDLVEKLGLRKIGKVIVRLANEEKIELEKAGSLSLIIGDREMSTTCLIGPLQCEPLVGQIVLEELDLITDSTNRTVIVRPESPYLPSLKLK